LKKVNNHWYHESATTTTKTEGYPIMGRVDAKTICTIRYIWLTTVCCKCDKFSVLF